MALEVRVALNLSVFFVAQLQPVNRRFKEVIESFGVLHHQEMPNSRHDDYLNAIVLEQSYVGRSVVRIDRDHWQM